MVLFNPPLNYFFFSDQWISVELQTHRNQQKKAFVMCVAASGIPSM